MSVLDRYLEFLAKVDILAQESGLEVEFTVNRSMVDLPCVEVLTTDDHRYLLINGSTEFGKGRYGTL